jgi:hypothetical protein
VRGGRFRGSLREAEQSVSTREGRGHRPARDPPPARRRNGHSVEWLVDDPSRTQLGPPSDCSCERRPSDRHRTRRRTDRAARPAIGRGSGAAPFRAERQWLQACAASPSDPFVNDDLERVLGDSDRAQLVVPVAVPRERGRAVRPVVGVGEHTVDPTIGRPRWTFAEERLATRLTVASERPGRRA